MHKRRRFPKCIDYFQTGFAENDVYKSHLINLNCVKSYNKGVIITLNDVIEIEVSPTHKEDFLKNLSEALTAKCAKENRKVRKA